MTDDGKSSGSRIIKKVWIRASAEVVYQALTESRHLTHWFCDKASCDPREGGELLAQWNTGKSRQKGRAIITRISPNRALDLLWTDDGAGSQEKASKHTLSYEIRTKSGMTELIMTDQDDCASDEETATFLEQGWNSVLMELKDFCENKERTVRKSADSHA